MTRSALPIFKGGTKRGRNSLKLLGGAGKMAARGAHTLYARSPIRSASGALAPVTPKPTALCSCLQAALKVSTPNERKHLFRPHVRRPAVRHGWHDHQF